MKVQDGASGECLHLFGYVWVASVREHDPYAASLASREEYGEESYQYSLRKREEQVGAALACQKRNAVLTAMECTLSWLMTPPRGDRPADAPR